MTSRLSEIAVDCADAPGLARFWCALLDWEVLEEEDGLVTIGRPGGSGPVLTFARVPEAKSVKNRLHLDVTPVDRSQVAEVDRLLGLGARRVDVGQGRGGGVSWVVLADPEGNEFCVLAEGPP